MIPTAKRRKTTVERANFYLSLRVSEAARAQRLSSPDAELRAALGSSEKQVTALIAAPDEEANDEWGDSEEAEQLLLPKAHSLDLPRIKDDFYREVATLGPGSSFGELALIQAKPRAATVVCKEPTVLAFLDRQAYDKVLRKLQQNQLGANVRFLQSVPFFRAWTKNSVAKFSYFFEKRRFRRNQLVYREGDPCERVFLVRSGEFEVRKRVRARSTQALAFDMTEFLPQKRDKTYALNVKNGRFIQAVNSFKARRAVETVQSVRLMIVGVGNIVGEEDAVKDRHYSTSLSCFSQEGELYEISLENFHRFVKSTDMETWLMLERNALQKELHALRIMEAKFKLEEEG